MRQPRIPLPRFASGVPGGLLQAVLLIASGIGFPAHAVPGDVRWSFATGQSIRSSPALGPDGTVYFTAGARIFALDGRTGAQRWVASAARTISSPALGPNGTLYAGGTEDSPSRAAVLLAFESATGNRRWSRWATNDLPELLASPALTRDGTLLFITRDASAYVLDAATGKTRWEKRLDDEWHVYSSPAIGADGTAYTGLGERGVCAFAIADGTVRWQARPGGAFHGSPALAPDGTVFVGSTDGLLYAFDGADGDVRRVFSARDSITSSVAIGTDGTLYFGSDDRRVYAVDGGTGRKRWEFLTGGAVHSTPALAADGSLYIGSYDRHVYALDSATGGLRWTFETGDRILGSAAIGDDGTVFIGSFDGKLYALEGGGRPAESPWPKFRGDARNTASAEFAGPPRVVAPARSRFVAAGSTVTLGGIVGGGGPLARQWHFGDQPIAGATNATLTLLGVDPDQAGTYRLVARNAEGSTETRADLAVGFRLDALEHGGGSVRLQPEQDLYLPGTRVELTAVPDDGRRILGWLGDLTGTVNPHVLAMDRNRQIAAKFDLRTGETAWTLGEPISVNGAPVVGPDGRVYVTGHHLEQSGSLLMWVGSLLMAVEGDSGRVLWRFGGSGVNLHSSVLSAQGRLFVMARRDGVYAIDAQTGTEIWHFHDERLYLEDPLAVGPDGSVHLGAFESKMRDVIRYRLALDGDTGKVRWRRGVPGYSDPVLSFDNRLYLTFNVPSSTPLMALDASTGNELWRLPLAGGSRYPPSMGKDGILFLSLFAGTNHLGLAVDGATGVERWRVDLGEGSVWPALIDTDGSLLVRTEDRILRLDAATGQIRKTFNTPAHPVWGSLFLDADGTILSFHHDPARIVAFNGRNGEVVWERVWSPLAGSSCCPFATLGTLGVGDLLYVGATEEWRGVSLVRLVAIQTAIGLAQTPWPAPDGDSGRSRLGRGPLRIDAWDRSQDGIGVTVPTFPGWDYRLEWKTSLDDNWWPRPVVSQKGTGGPLRLLDPSPGRDRGFYRVRVVPLLAP